MLSIIFFPPVEFGWQSGYCIPILKSKASKSGTLRSPYLFKKDFLKSSKIGFDVWGVIEERNSIPSIISFIASWGNDMLCWKSRFWIILKGGQSGIIVFNAGVLFIKNEQCSTASCEKEKWL